MPESKKNSSNPSHSRTTTQKRSIWQKTVTKEKVVKMKTLENNSKISGQIKAPEETVINWTNTINNENTQKE